MKKRHKQHVERAPAKPAAHPRHAREHPPHAERPRKPAIRKERVPTGQKLASAIREEEALESIGETEALESSLQRSPESSVGAEGQLEQAGDERPEERDAEPYEAPPLPGKVHPPREMGFVVPSLDDEIRDHHADQTIAEFDVDPDAADAAADLGGDLGAQFLEGATRGEDVSERAMADAEESETEFPFVVEEEPLSRPRRARAR